MLETVFGLIAITILFLIFAFLLSMLEDLRKEIFSKDEWKPWAMVRLLRFFIAFAYVGCCYSIITKN